MFDRAPARGAQLLRRACAVLARLALGAVIASSHAAAQDTSPVRVTSQFWQRLRSPESARGQALLRQGRALLIPALRVSTLLGAQASAHRRVAIEGALARFERARPLLPNDPELLFLMGKALLSFEQEIDGHLQQRSQDAIECLLALRRSNAWYEADSVAFELGVLYTRQGRFAEAAAEYRRALQLRLADDAQSATLGNLAEVTMLSGDLEGAVRLYEQATRESSGSSRLLSLWGLAVALDRLGEHGEALAVAQRAVHDDQAPMHVLEQGGVFFVPPHERHYYQALGSLALADLSARELGTRLGVPLTISLGTLSIEPLRALQRAAGDALPLGLGEWLTRLHGSLLDELTRRNRARVPAPRGSRANDLAGEVLAHLLEALSAFTRYGSEAGEQGRWASDARSHSERLSAAVSASQLRSHTKK